MYYKTGDISIYYEKYGTGNKSILILPGWGETRSTFYNIIDFLKDYYTVYIVDYPGFGKSIFPDYDLTIYDYANIVRNFIKDLKIKKPIIISHSFGGRISTILCGYYNYDIDKLIMIDVASIKPKKTIFKFIKEKSYKILKKINYILPKRIRKRYLNKLLSIFGSADYNSIPVSMRNTFKNIISEDLTCYLKNINCETLIIWGKLDYDTPLEHGIKMNRLINDSAIIIFEYAGHFSYLDYPFLITKIIKEFLD